MPELPLTLADLRARAQAAGVPIAETRLAMVHRLLGEALAAAQHPAAAPHPGDEPAIAFAPPARTRE